MATPIMKESLKGDAMTQISLLPYDGETVK